jgi:hypothetical protein
VVVSPLPAGIEWPGAQQVVCVERARFDPFNDYQLLDAQRAYYITSLAPADADPDTLLALVRGHWAIENKSHYVRDVTFREDASQVFAGQLPQVMAAFRNLALTIFRRFQRSSIPLAFIENAARPLNVLLMLAQ